MATELASALIYPSDITYAISGTRELQRTVTTTVRSDITPKDNWVTSVINLCTTENIKFKPTINKCQHLNKHHKVIPINITMQGT